MVEGICINLRYDRCMNLQQDKDMTRQVYREDIQQRYRHKRGYKYRPERDLTFRHDESRHINLTRQKYRSKKLKNIDKTRGTEALTCRKTEVSTSHMTDVLTRRMTVVWVVKRMCDIQINELAIHVCNDNE